MDPQSAPSPPPSSPTESNVSCQSSRPVSPPVPAARYFTPLGTESPRHLNSPKRSFVKSSMFGFIPDAFSEKSLQLGGNEPSRSRQSSKASTPVGGSPRHAKGTATPGKDVTGSEPCVTNKANNPESATEEGVENNGGAKSGNPSTGNSRDAAGSHENDEVLQVTLGHLQNGDQVTEQIELQRAGEVTAQPILVSKLTHLF